MLRSTWEQLRQARQWQGTDVFIFVLRTVWFASSVVILNQAGLGGHRYGLLLVLFSLSYLIPQLFFRPGCVRPGLYIILEVFVTGSLFVYVSFLFGGAGAFKFLYLPLTVGYVSRRRTGLGGLVVVVVLPLLSLWFGRFSGSLGAIFDFFAMYFAFFGLGYVLNRMMEANATTQDLLNVIREKNEVLEQYAGQVEKLAVVEERNRMARELHDTVGHTFTSTIMGMDAVLLLIDRSPEDAKENLRELLAMTRQGLDEVRSSIHRMAEEEEGTLAAALKQLADEFARHTGTDIKVEVSGAETEMPASLRNALIRCMQEALTNAKRHGHASRVDVSLVYQTDLILLKIEDDGEGADLLVPGFGLNGMKERLGQYRGTLDIRSKPGEGTALTCIVPQWRSAVQTKDQKTG